MTVLRGRMCLQPIDPTKHTKDTRVYAQTGNNNVHPRQMELDIMGIRYFRSRYTRGGGLQSDGRIRQDTGKGGRMELERRGLSCMGKGDMVVGGGESFLQHDSVHWAN